MSLSTTTRRLSPRLFLGAAIRSTIFNVDRNASQIAAESLSLNDAYLRTRQKCESKKLPLDVNPKGVFACNELDLKEVSIYGFDYDYTLAVYKASMDTLLYNLGLEGLISKFKYPVGIKDMVFDPSFAIRGLHYDIEKGLLMKLDSFLQIQLGTVYRGLSPIPDADVIKVYKNKTVPLAYVENHGKTDPYSSSKMIQLADLFSVPEMCLLCNVSEFFERSQIDYHPEILFRDVKTSVGAGHPKMHRILQENVGEYLEKNPGLIRWFKRLKQAGKKLFLITNSPYLFVNAGMRHIIGDNWEDFFDLIIVRARKPMFFTDESRPLRIYDKVLNVHVWDKVNEIKKGTIYYEGTLNQLQQLTGWRGSEVLYFGDHAYSDLADVTLEHGWRTGAIIQELSHEIDTLNQEEFKRNCNWLQMLTQLIEECQEVDEADAQTTLCTWMMERDKLRQDIKKVFNPQFGSVFRTYHNPTYFSRRLFRFADIYTSSITNLLHYSVHHTFYPRRGVMPHEYSSYFV